VVESNSFSEAARRLSVPLSTVSRRVADLENQLGVQLIERSTRKLSRLTERLRRLKAAVVVAVIAVLVMDVALHEKIDVTRMWHGLVPAGRIVTVGWIVSVTIVPTHTIRWIRAGSTQLVLVNVPLVHVMQMPVVQIISVIVVLRSGMPAGSAVSMFVRVVRCMWRHG
jgi:hypothetical protein